MISPFVRPSMLNNIAKVLTIMNTSYFILFFGSNSGKCTPMHLVEN